jgi:hypothetical protein
MNDRRVVVLLVLLLLPFLQLLLLLLLQLELSALVLRGEDRRSALGFGRQGFFGDRSRDVPFFLVDRSKKIKNRRCLFNEGGRVEGGPVAVVQQHLAVHPEPTPRTRQALVDPAQHRGLNIERLGRLLLERLNEDGLARVQAPANNNVSVGFAKQQSQ